jgi:hypothetical protein
MHTSADFIIVGLEEFQFSCRCDVGNVQTCSLFLCQADGKGGTLVAGFVVADNGVETDVGVVAVLLFHFSHFGVDASRILAMCHDE